MRVLGLTWTIAALVRKDEQGSQHSQKKQNELRLDSSEELSKGDKVIDVNDRNRDW